MKNGRKRRRLQGTGLCFALTAAIAVGLSPTTIAQADGSAATDRVASELAGLRGSVDRLVRLMEAQLAQRDVELLLRRIEMKERRVAPMEGRLSDLKAQRRQVGMEESNFAEYVSQIEDSLEEARRSGDSEAEKQAEQELDGLERLVKMQAGRKEDLERQIQELENLLAGSRDEIRDLDDQLQEMLEP